jgi:hypothetical protein
MHVVVLRQIGFNVRLRRRPAEDGSRARLRQSGCLQSIWKARIYGLPAGPLPVTGSMHSSSGDGSSSVLGVLGTVWDPLKPDPPLVDRQQARERVQALEAKRGGGCSSCHGLAGRSAGRGLLAG